MFTIKSMATPLETMLLWAASKGWKEADLARHLDISQATITNWKARKALPPARHSQIAKAFNRTVDDLLTGGPLVYAPVSSGNAVTERTAGYAKPSDDSIAVPLFSNSGAMGDGSEELHDDVVQGALSLSRTWLRREVRPSSASALRFIHAYGDSMSPTFTDGDVLLVDTGARDAQNIDGVYVLRAHGRLFIKRVGRRLDGKAEISSDNPTVKTVELLDGSQTVEVAGRVIWVWNGRKL